MSKVAVVEVRSDLDGELEKLIGLAVGSDFLALGDPRSDFLAPPAYAGARLSILSPAGGKRIAEIWENSEEVF